MDECLHCGKPLGNRTALCYTCASEGITPEEGIDVDEAVRDRIERYCIVAATKCPNCGDLHTTVTVDGIEYTAADFGIESLEDWQLELDKEETWIRENPSDVEAVLPLLADEWPRSVSTIRSRLL